MLKRNSHNFQVLLLIVLIWFSLVLTKTPETGTKLLAGKESPSFSEAIAASTLKATFSQFTAEASSDNLFVVIPQVFLPKNSLPPPTAIPSSAVRTAIAEQTVVKQKENSVSGQPVSPPIQSRAVLVSDLDAGSDVLVYNGKQRWPLASLTKLMTAVLAIEEMGKGKGIVISRTAVMTEGDSGRLKPGEVYTIEDLIKTMMIASSNDAAAALAEFYAFGKENFFKLMNKKAQELEMNQTVFFDSSGLSPLNQSTVYDLKNLVIYITEKHPELWDYSRETNFRDLKNINFFAEQDNSLGGKTGYLEESKQNLAALFSVNRHRFVIIILGAADRKQQTQNILDYLSKI